jgi:hypothetical protein
LTSEGKFAEMFQKVRGGNPARSGVVSCAVSFGAVLASAAVVLADPSDICITSARQASAQTDVPLSVMLAVTQTETGRRVNGRLRPWPWTVNLEGAGHWFEDRGEALDFATQGAEAGRNSFDVGCFQINYRWHGENFESLAEMFDPLENALYAARFLSRLHAETGDWSKAAGAFHSRTPEFADRYRATFDRHRAAAIEEGADRDGPTLASALASDVVVPRVNSFPLLRQNASGGQLGSLVPLGSGS